MWLRKASSICPPNYRGCAKAAICSRRNSPAASIRSTPTYCSRAAIFIERVYLRSSPRRRGPSDLCSELDSRFRGNERNKSIAPLPDAPFQHAGEPLGEGTRVGRAVALEHARFVEQEVHGIFLKRALLAAEASECHH